MSSLVFLVPISLALLGVAIWAFVWAVRRGQFDDLETPAVQILVDEPRPDSKEPPSNASNDAGPDSGAQAHDASHDEAEARPPRAD